MAESMYSVDCHEGCCQGSVADKSCNHTKNFNKAPTSSKFEDDIS